ncbi:MAG: hypothetical protein ACLFR0_01210 [Alphaproteobacteria bacterium]
MFMILIAIALIGLLTAVISNSNSTDNSDIDGETLTIRASEVQRYASELERGINYIMQNGVSESDIRFAIPTDTANATGYGDDGDVNTNPQAQMFHPNGGGATYRDPPQNIQSTVSAWEFYGGTRIPGAGTNRADLIAVLPNVTAQFCQKINEINGQSATPAEDGSGNINAGVAARFGSGGTTVTFDDSTPNTLNTGSFSKIPALQACVTVAGSPAEYHFYHVIMPR